MLKIFYIDLPARFFDLIFLTAGILLVGTGILPFFFFGLSNPEVSISQLIGDLSWFSGLGWSFSKKVTVGLNVYQITGIDRLAQLENNFTKISLAYILLLIADDIKETSKLSCLIKRKKAVRKILR